MYMHLAFQGLMKKLQWPAHIAKDRVHMGLGTRLGNFALVQNVRGNNLHSTTRPARKHVIYCTCNYQYIRRSAKLSSIPHSFIEMLRELALFAALLAVSAAARLQVDEPMESSLDDVCCYNDR